MKSALTWPLLFALAISAAACAPAQARPASALESVSTLRKSLDSEHEHTTIAIVTRIGDPFYAQDRTGGMEVRTGARLPSLRIGDRVLLTGHLQASRYSPIMSATSVRVLDSGAPAPPISVTSTMLASGIYDHLFVETEGILESRRDVGGRSWFLLRSNDEPFVAEVPAEISSALSLALTAGATISVRGICIMDQPNSGEAVPFVIATRSAEDLRIVAPPPFWTREHILELLFVMFSIGLALTAIYVRIQRWRFDTVLAERTRMAHDLHDTLAQSFAGIAFQLQAIRNSVTLGTRNLDSQIDMAVGMVSHCHEDARRSIASLKPADLDTGDLGDNLRQQAEALTRGGAFPIHLSIDGDSMNVPKPLEVTLLRIGHEAITNAIRHARPSEMSISLSIKLTEVSLLVRDDGCGFDYAARRAAGFGMRSMAARAHAHGGTLTVATESGGGTTVRVTLPLKTRRPNMSAILSFVRAERK